MDKEDLFDLMVKFITHTKEYAPEAFEFVIGDMEENEMFIINGEDLQEQFEEQL